VRILVVGDSYIPADVFESGLLHLRPRHELDVLQIDQSRPFQPSTEAEVRLREFAGSPDQISAALDGHDVLVVHGAPVTESVLAGSALRLVCCARGGPVNVDTAAATRRGIPVVTTPGKNAESVADQTIAFMIMLARRFPLAQRFLLEGNQAGLSAFEGAQFFGHDLVGHTLGLVGFGNVGSRVATRARAFGMTVLVYDPFVASPAGDGAGWVTSLEELLGRSDFVSVHARATADNRRMFAAAAFAAMRPGAFFINTARESLVDEAALEQALMSGHLAGAALDVVDPQPGPGVHPLLRHPNVVITPHIGGATHETVLRGIHMIAAEIERFSEGAPLQNVADPAALEMKR
jgi:D-3-phosphoglycerate dehydrogenase / 2-oxoglutarate reductase